MRLTVSGLRNMILFFSRLTAKGITISAILLNNKSSAYPELTHPLSRGGSANYYAFNAAEADGVETLAAVGAFLAQRYRDNDHGIVMNWIVGNEVNVRSDWNYMQYVDLDTYAREYANAVRGFLQQHQEYERECESLCFDGSAVESGSVVEEQL